MHLHVQISLAAIAAGVLVASVCQIVKTWLQKPLPPPATVPEMWANKEVPPMSDENILNQVEAEVASVVQNDVVAPVEAAAPAGIVATIESDVEAFIKKLEHIATVLEMPLHSAWSEIVALAKKL